MAVGSDVSFEDCAVVACGTLSPELRALRKSGFLNAAGILYTRPGRHEDPRELESQLVRRIGQAGRFARKIIVVYGGKFCFIDPRDPGRTIDDVIAEQGGCVSRVAATHCVDMLADARQREELSGGEKVFWLTPGWIIYRDYVFQDWDRGKANESFPQHTGGAVLLDAVHFFEEYSESHPERILEFSDWMGIPILPREVKLDRLEELLCDCALRLGAGSRRAPRSAP